MSKLSLAGEWKLRGEFMDVTADRCAEVLVHLNAMPPKPTIPGYLTEENMTEEEREMYLKEPDPKFTVNTALAMHPYPSKTGYIPMTVPGDVTTALIDNGVIEEEGTPEEVFDNPIRKIPSVLFLQISNAFCMSVPTRS